MTNDCLGFVLHRYECKSYSLFYLDEKGDFINDDHELRERDEQPSTEIPKTQTLSAKRASV